MDLGDSNIKTSGAVEWFSESFFVKHSAEDNKCRSIEPATPNNKKESNNGSDVQRSAPIKPGFTPTRGTKCARNKKIRYLDQKQSRSRSVRGAANISKETRFLKSKIDRLFESYQQTVLAASQSNATQLETLKAENQQLRVQLEELETETLRQFSELEDREELIAATEERRLSSHNEASMWKLECQKLAKEVAFLKATIENYNHRASGVVGLRFRHEKPTESLSTNEPILNVATNYEAGNDPCDCNKENANVIVCNSTSCGALSNAGGSESNASLLAAREVFGNEIPASFLTTEHRFNNRTKAQGNIKKNRKSIHAMTLRER